MPYGIPEDVKKLAAVVVAASLVAACKDSKPSKPAKEPERNSAAPVDTGWVERLPQGDDASSVALANTAGLVGIKADGTIVVAPPPAAGAPPLGESSVSTLEQIIPALGITGVSPRSDDAFATIDAEADPFAQLAHPAMASGAPAPAKRETTVYSRVHANDVSAGVVVLADARARAGILVDVLTRTGGFLAVRKGGELGALPLSFDRQSPPAVAPDNTWIELRMGKSIDVEKVPAKAVSVDAIDKLAGDALQGAKAVDVLVGAETTVDELVKAIGKLRAANVEAIGFGHVPAELATRGEQGPRVLAWDFQQQGQGDAAAIRAAFDATLEPIRACYGKALAKKAGLAGTAQVQVFVGEAGAVAKLAVVDVAPVLVQCATTALKATKFPATNVAGVMLNARLGFLPPR
jgi:hypothetical protein